MCNTIKISDILAKVKPFTDHVESIFELTPNLEELELSLETGTYLGWSEQFNKRVKVLAVNAWLCTDTMVGVNAYYLDGEFVALSFQSARKNHTEFKWTSADAAKKIKVLIREISEEANELSIQTINPEEDIGSDWLLERPIKAIHR